MVFFKNVRFTLSWVVLFFVVGQSVQAENRVAVKAMPPVISLLLGDESIITVDDVRITEGDSGHTQLDFLVVLDRLSDKVTVDFQLIGGSAVVGLDFSALAPGTLEFTGSSLSKSISVSIIGDSAVESDETFQLRLSNPSGGNFSGSQATIVATATIINDDKPPLNDTGITFGGDYPSGNNATCTGDVIDQQDCSHGRDEAPHDDSDGVAGFSFTKISASGVELTAAMTTWSCVKDNVTGLMWEKKTDDSGSEFNKENVYSWGGISAQGRNHANREGSYFDSWNALVNAANVGNGLCGYRDWRLPTYVELQSIVHSGRVNPTIDVAYFPNTKSGNYWSSSAVSANSSFAWDVNFNFGNGYFNNRSASRYVRLVR